MIEAGLVLLIEPADKVTKPEGSDEKCHIMNQALKVTVPEFIAVSTIATTKTPFAEPTIVELSANSQRTHFVANWLEPSEHRVPIIPRVAMHSCSAVPLIK